MVVFVGWWWWLGDVRVRVHASVEVKRMGVCVWMGMVLKKIRDFKIALL